MQFSNFTNFFLSFSDNPENSELIKKALETNSLSYSQVHNISGKYLHNLLPQKQGGLHGKL